MSAPAPTTHPLMDQLLAELEQRNVQLDNQSREAIEQEFERRLMRNPKPEALLDGWARNFPRYRDLLDQTARKVRQDNGMDASDIVVLNLSQVRPTFVICAKLCPGPA